MAKGIEKIAGGLGAKVVGQVPDAGEDAFGAARLAKQEQASLPDSGMGLIGAMRDEAELLDEIVEDAMRRRQVSAWLPSREDFAALQAMAEETGQPLNELLDEALRLLLHHRKSG